MSHCPSPSTNINNSVRILLPSMGNIVFLGVFLPIVFFGERHVLLGDTDTGYHIRAGEIILETLSVPKHDVFSFHSPALPWTAHEWLSEVMMALIHRAYGLTGIVIFFALLISSTYYLFFKILQTSKRNIILSVSLVFLVIASSTLHWLARPHIFSLILILAYHYILDTYQYHDRNYLYLLPVLMIAWVNLHGGFIVGFILLAIYLASNLSKYPFLRKSERTAIRGKILAFALALLCCLLVSLINPYGYRILAFPLSLVSDTFLMDHVTEFQSPNFHGTLPFRYLLFLTIGIFALSGSRANIIELALVLLFTHMSLYSARYIPLFAIIVSPISLKHAELFLEKADTRLATYFKSKSANIALVDSSLYGYLWPIAAMLAVYIAVASGKIHFQFDEKANPMAAVEFLRKENLHGHMFNNDSFGDYVIYAAWPQYKVFVDGRSDMYGASRIREYLNVIFLAPGWEKILQKYDINWIFYDAKSPLSVTLLEHPDWRLIYADEVAHIYLRNSEENYPIIHKFRHVKALPAANNI